MRLKSFTIDSQVAENITLVQVFKGNKIRLCKNIISGLEIRR